MGFGRHVRQCGMRAQKVNASCCCHWTNLARCTSFRMVRRQRCATIRLEAISNKHQKSHTHVKFWLQERIEKCPSHLHQWFGFFSGKVFVFCFPFNPKHKLLLNIRANFFILLFENHSSLSSSSFIIIGSSSNLIVHWIIHASTRPSLRPYGSDRTTTMATPCNT